MKPRDEDARGGAAGGTQIFGGKFALVEGYKLQVKHHVITVLASGRTSVCQASQTLFASYVYSFEIIAEGFDNFIALMFNSPFFYCIVECSGKHSKEQGM